MFIIHRIYRKNNEMGHSTQFFDIDIPVNTAELPQEVKNRVYSICAADGNDNNIDYAMVQAVDHKGVVWRTEVIKPMPTPEQ